ncbi:MAG: MFS transporter [Candidatus Atribacteria bacterium]|nr:MFS transporter [Candidatus Atribacteria bacterium]
MRRVSVILAGITILICLGTVYSYSVFRVSFEQTLGINAVQSGLPYMLALFFYAFFMPISGRFANRFPPHWISIAGGSLMSLGWILASVSPSLLSLVLFYGVLGGTGVGIAYGMPLIVATRAFPEKPGFALGATVIGFGLSPLITAPLVRYLTHSHGPFFALRVMGIAFWITTVTLSLFLRFQSPSVASHNPHSSPTTRVTTFKTQKFWLLWFFFFIGTFVGLTTIGMTTSIAREIVGLTHQTATLSVSLFALFNGLSRPLFGYLVDHYPFRIVASLSYFLLSLGLLFFLLFPNQPLVYFFSIALLWMNLGAWLAIAPSATLRFFGAETYAQNYGLLFTAYGASALSGTFFSSLLRDLTGSYMTIFLVNLLLVLLGFSFLWTFLKEGQHP